MEGLKELLKKHLGDSYTEELAAAIDAETETLIGKNFVSRADFNEKNKAWKAMQKQLDELDGTNLKAELDKLKVAHQQELEAIKTRQRGSALDRAIKAAGAKNPKAVKALLDAEKLKYSDENEDTIDGLDEQLKALLASDAYLFDTPGGNAPQGTGFDNNKTPPPADTPKANTGVI